MEIACHLRAEHAGREYSSVRIRKLGEQTHGQKNSDPGSHFIPVVELPQGREEDLIVEQMR